MYRTEMEKIIKATNKCINNIKKAFIKEYQTGRIKAFIKEYQTGRIKASRKHFR